MKNPNHEAELIFQQIKSQELQFQYDVIGELEKKVDALKKSKVDKLNSLIQELENVKPANRVETPTVTLNLTQGGFIGDWNIEKRTEADAELTQAYYEK